MKKFIGVLSVFFGKKLVFVLIFTPLVSVSIVRAQTSFQISQFFMVPNLYNPASVGANDYLDIKTGYRQQWSGFEDAPETYFLSFQGNLNRNKKLNFKNNAIRVSDPQLINELLEKEDIRLRREVSHGIGGIVVRDQQGAFTRNMANLAYALHFMLGKKTSLALGVSGNLENNQVDFGKIRVGNPDQDDLYNQYLQNNGRGTIFQLNSGLYMYSPVFTLGYSAENLYTQVVEDVNGSAMGEDADAIGHNFIAGFRLGLSEKVDLIPGALVRYSKADPVVIDYNLKVSYQNIGWIGGSYRNNNAVIGMAGISLTAPLYLSYAYDHSLSGLSNFANGSHEVILGVRLFNNNGAKALLW